MTGDVLLDGSGEPRVERAWVPDFDEVAAKLRPLLELRVELVLPTHGDPVERDARDALARALAS